MVSVVANKVNVLIDTALIDNSFNIYISHNVGQKKVFVQNISTLSANFFEQKIHIYYEIMLFTIQKQYFSTEFRKQLNYSSNKEYYNEI